MIGINQAQPRESAIDRIAKVLGIVNAGTQIGANVYGVKKGMDESARVEQALKEENSPLSALVTERAKVAGITVPEGMTNRQAKAAGLLEAIEKANQYKHEMAKIDRENAGRIKVAEASRENKPATGDQSKAALFGRRMEQAEAVINSLSEAGFDPTTVDASLQGSKLYPNMFRDKEVQKHGQAKDNFINAVLRRESGAAIAPSEYEMADRQYFPVNGDSTDVLQQKAENRALAIAAMKQEAGKAWDEIKQPQAVSFKVPGKDSIIPNAQASPPKFSAEDLDMAVKVKAALNANPNDPDAIQVKQILQSKGLRF